MLTAAPFVIAGLVFAIAGAFVLPGSLTDKRANMVAPFASASSTQIARHSPSASATATPLVADVRKRGRRVRAAGNGPALAWERINMAPGNRLFYYDGTFVMLGNPDRAGALVSKDGLTWSERAPTELEQAMAEGQEVYPFGDGYVSVREAAWMPDLYDADGVRRPRCGAADAVAGPCAAPIPEGMIVSLAASPAGLVVTAQISSRQVVADVLGDEVAQGEWRWLDYDPPRDRNTAVWSLETEDGTVHDVTLRDHGLFPDSHESVLLGWYSPDGREWTRLPHLPGEHMIGSTDGFWVQEGGRQWFSSDGLRWKRIGAARAESEVWPGRAGLVMLRNRRGEPGRFYAATPSGVSELPMSKRARQAMGSSSWQQMVLGPLGIVAFDRDDQTILFSADGEHWGVSHAPATWSAPRSPSGGASFSLATMDVVVGDKAVLAVRGRCPATKPTAKKCGAFGAFEGTVPWEYTLWRGTPVESDR